MMMLSGLRAQVLLDPEVFGQGPTQCRTVLASMLIVPSMWCQELDT